VRAPSAHHDCGYPEALPPTPLLQKRDSPSPHPPLALPHTSAMLVVVTVGAATLQRGSPPTQRHGQEPPTYGSRIPPVEPADLLSPTAANWTWDPARGPTGAGDLRGDHCI
jgi:hypothetical protein